MKLVRTHSYNISPEGWEQLCNSPPPRAKNSSALVPIRESKSRLSALLKANIPILDKWHWFMAGGGLFSYIYPAFLIPTLAVTLLGIRQELRSEVDKENDDIEEREDWSSSQGCVKVWRLKPQPLFLEKFLCQTYSQTSAVVASCRLKQYFPCYLRMSIQEGTLSFHEASVMSQYLSVRKSAKRPNGAKYVISNNQIWGFSPKGHRKTIAKVMVSLAKQMATLRVSLDRIADTLRVECERSGNYNALLEWNGEKHAFTIALSRGQLELIVENTTNVPPSINARVTDRTHHSVTLALGVANKKLPKKVLQITEAFDQSSEKTTGPYR